MSRKVVIPPYEQMILNIGTMSADQLYNFVSIAKARLAQLKPRGTKPKSKAKPELREQAS